MRSLRARQFAAIALAVVASVVLTLVVAAVLVRRSVQDEALKSLSRQTELIAEQQRSGRPANQRLSSIGLFFATQQERLTIVSLPQAAFLLPGAAEALRAGRPAQGKVEVGNQTYLYAARPVEQKAVVLLRSAKLEAADWHPFTLAFVIAGLAGAGLAAITAFVLAGTVARPIRRVASASLHLAGGERPGPLPIKGSSEVASLASAFNQMAEELDRAKNAERAFLLSVSHELKTPLAAIRGHGEALLEHVIDARTAGRVIVQEGKRLERLVRDLLDLAGLNQRAFTVRREALDLAELAEEVARRHQTEARRVDVALVTQRTSPAPALGDPDRVVQVLSNLIENALRSTPAGGTVTVTAEPGALTVADTGPGLASEDLPRAFERFFLYGRYAQNRAVGTGLGLAVVKELTEAMQGSVTVQSQPGAGATFVVSLPLTE